MKKKKTPWNKGVPMSEEQKKKCSDAQKKRFLSGHIQPWTGKPLSDERKKHISEIQRGKKLSEDHKRNISEALKKIDMGKWLRGKTVSMETGKKKSASMKRLVQLGKLKTLFKKGVPSWCAGKKNPKMTGENNPNWKGDNAGKVAMHVWVYNHKGRPLKCGVCARTTKETIIDYSNIDHKYRRNLDDYKPMCRSCHRKYDYKNHPSNIGSKWGSIKNKVIKKYG